MKKLLIALLLSAPVLACDKGQVWYEGVCADDPKPSYGVNEIDKPSDEKPPRHPEPAYQRGEVIVDDAKLGVEPSSMTAHDYAAERNQR